MSKTKSILFTTTKEFNDFLEDFDTTEEEIIHAIKENGVPFFLEASFHVAHGLEDKKEKVSFITERIDLIAEYIAWVDKYGKISAENKKTIVTGIVEHMLTSPLFNELEALDKVVLMLKLQKRYYVLKDCERFNQHFLLLKKHLKVEEQSNAFLNALAQEHIQKNENCQKLGIVSIERLIIFLDFLKSKEFKVEGFIAARLSTYDMNDIAALILAYVNKVDDKIVAMVNENKASFMAMLKDFASAFTKQNEDLLKKLLSSGKCSFYKAFAELPSSYRFFKIIQHKSSLLDSFEATNACRIFKGEAELFDTVLAITNAVYKLGLSVYQYKPDEDDDEYADTKFEVVYNYLPTNVHAVKMLALSVSGNNEEVSTIGKLNFKHAINILKESKVFSALAKLNNEPYAFASIEKALLEDKDNRISSQDFEKMASDYIKVLLDSKKLSQVTSIMLFEDEYKKDENKTISISFDALLEKYHEDVNKSVDIMALVGVWADIEKNTDLGANLNHLALLEVMANKLAVATGEMSLFVPNKNLHYFSQSPTEMWLYKTALVTPRAAGDIHLQLNLSEKYLNGKYGFERSSFMNNVSEYIESCYWVKKEDEEHKKEMKMLARNFYAQMIANGFAEGDVLNIADFKIFDKDNKNKMRIKFISKGLVEDLRTVLGKDEDFKQAMLAIVNERFYETQLSLEQVNRILFASGITRQFSTSIESEVMLHDHGHYVTRSSTTSTVYWGGIFDDYLFSAPSHDDKRKNG